MIKRLLFLLYISSSGLSLHAVTDIKADKQLVPFCNNAGKWGYVDAHTDSVWIEAKFDEAQPFHNGYAIAVVNKKYGVIDERGSAIVPFKYSFAALYMHDAFILLITKTEYNAWWQLSKWRFMPDFNILSTSHKGPVLVTKVPRAVWKIRSLPGKEILYRSKRKDDQNDWGSRYWTKGWKPFRNIPADIEISSIGKILLVAHKANYQQADQQLSKIHASVFGILNDSTLLASNGEKYFKINISGRRIDNQTYTQVQHIPFTTETGDTIIVGRDNKDMPQYKIIDAPVFKNSTGDYYLFPDFSLPLPLNIPDYYGVKDTVTGKELLTGAVTITKLARLHAVLFYTAAGTREPGLKTLFLKMDGTWDSTLPSYGGLDKILTDDRMIFSRGSNKGILENDHVFYNAPMENIVPCMSERMWYMGKDIVTGKYGVYDVQQQAWQVAPRYSYLQNEIVPDIAIYTIVRTGEDSRQAERYGLLNIRTGQQITLPLYDVIGQDGKASRTEQGNQITCYIDPYTGKEYRK